MEENVFIPNKKGLKLAATLYKPEGKGQFPGVIFLTGFSQNRKDAHVVSLCKNLAAQGIAAISFETAGVGESDGAIEEFSLTNYYNDVDAIYEYFSTQSFIDKERVGIAGHSLGSVVALFYAAKNPTNIKGIAAIMPFTTFSKLDLGVSMVDWQTSGYDYTKPTGEVVNIAYAFVEDADKANVLDIVNNLSQPKLIIMSTGDDVGNPEVTRDIYEHAAEPKELFILDNVEHTYKKNPQGVAYVNKVVVAFFQENL